MAFLTDFRQPFRSNRRRGLQINLQPQEVQLLENRCLLSTVRPLDSTIATGTVYAADKDTTYGNKPDPPQKKSATWDSSGKMHPASSQDILQANSGSGAAGLKAGIQKGTGENPSISGAMSFVLIRKRALATMEGGTGIHGGDPINLRIIPDGEDESTGDPVRVTMTGIAFRSGVFSKSSYNIEYTYESETHVLGSGTLPSKEFRKSVTFEAEIGDDFDIAFDAEAQLSAGTDLVHVNGFVGIIIKVEPIKVDLVAKSLAWDTAKGGLTFKYAIKEGSLPESKPPRVELFWAKGSERIGNPIGLGSTFKAQTKQGEYSFNVPGTKLRNVPKGATHLILVLDRLDVIKETNEENNSSNVKDVAVRLGPDVEGVVKVPTLAVINRLQREAGQAIVNITEMERTPLRQAQIMFDNCLSQGVDSQLKLYKDPGDQVIKVYIAQTKGLTDEQIKAKRDSIVKLMLKKILSFDPVSKVSHHIVQGNLLQVVDIAPSSFSTASAKDRFLAAADTAKKAGLISHIIKPGEGEKAIHLEIPQ